MMASRKAVLDKNKQQLLDSVNLSNKIYSNEELSILVSNLMEQQEQTLNKVYPVGSIYISYHNTNPSSLFGGTWVAYATGRTLVGVDISQTEFNTIGKTGGEKTHVLTETEMPKHYHKGFYYEVQGNVGYSIALDSGTIGYRLPWEGEGGSQTSGKGRGDTRLMTGSTGSNQAHNNLQPYITVYMWRRTA